MFLPIIVRFITHFLRYTVLTTKRKGDERMGFFLILAAFITLGLCLAKDKTDRRRFLGGVLALLYIPIATIMALTKNYK